MLIENTFIQDFYNKVKNEHTLVLVNADVDAVCTSMILTYALGCDNASYSLCPVDSKASIEKAFTDHSALSKHIIMINCAGHISLIDCDGLATNATVYVIDSRRPFHLDNIFSTNVKILVSSSEISSWKLPEFQAIYAESDSEDSDDEERGIGSSRYQERLIKKNSKAEWQRKRAELLWGYYSKTWHAMPSSVLALELVHTMGKSNAQTTWLAAVGMSSLYADWQMSIDTYTDLCLDNMRSFVSKYNHSSECMKLSMEEEILLPLYSRWSLLESMTHDIVFCCSNKLWSQKGDNTLKHTLARLGISLEECRQPFDSLRSEDRNRIFDALKKHFNTDFVAFFCKLEHVPRISALDFARILAVRLELCLPHSPETLCDRYNAAVGLMAEFFKNNGVRTYLDTAVQSYKQGLTAIKSLVFNAISNSSIHISGNFCSLTLDPTPDDMYLSSRHYLHVFMTFAISGFASSKRRSISKPLVVAIPSIIPGEENARYYTISGCMPYAEFLSDNNRKSIIPMAFKHALEQANITAQRNLLDPSLIQIRKEDGHKFFTSLDMVLESAN